MNQPIETYTFSRALHMMRYGSKKMQSIITDDIYKVENGLIYRYNKKKEWWGAAFHISESEIMGSWVEVK